MSDSTGDATPSVDEYGDMRITKPSIWLCPEEKIVLSLLSAGSLISSISVTPNPVKRHCPVRKKICPFESSSYYRDPDYPWVLVSRYHGWEGDDFFVYQDYITGEPVPFPSFLYENRHKLREENMKKLELFVENWAKQKLKDTVPVESTDKDFEKSEQ